MYFLFFSSRSRHKRFDCDWSSDVCSSDLLLQRETPELSASTATNGATEARTEVQLLKLQPDYAMRAMEPLKNMVDWLADRKSVVKGKGVDLGGGRIIKKKYRQEMCSVLDV